MIIPNSPKDLFLKKIKVVIEDIKENKKIEIEKNRKNIFAQLEMIREDDAMYGKYFILYANVFDVAQQIKGVRLEDLANGYNEIVYLEEHQ